MGGDAQGGGSPEHLFDELMQSPGHKANILDREFLEAGVGARRGDYTSFDGDPATAYAVDFGAWFGPRPDDG